jgi:hypothetical protein
MFEISMAVLAWLLQCNRDYVKNDPRIIILAAYDLLMMVAMCLRLTIGSAAFTGKDHQEEQEMGRSWVPDDRSVRREFPTKRNLGLAILVRRITAWR